MQKTQYSSQENNLDMNSNSKNINNNNNNNNNNNVFMTTADTRQFAQKQNLSASGAAFAGIISVNGSTPIWKGCYC